MNRLNVAICIGLILSGSSLILGYLLALFNMPGTAAGFLLGIGVYFGWFFGAFATVVFIVGTLVYFIGRLSNYWQSLYPTDFGLTLLGLAFVGYNSGMSSFRIVVTFILGVLLGYALYRFNITRFRLLILVLVGLFLFYPHFWMLLFVGLVLVSLSVFNGTISKAFKDANMWHWLHNQFQERW